MDSKVLHKLLIDLYEYFNIDNVMNTCDVEQFPVQYLYETLRFKRGIPRSVVSYDLRALAFRSHAAVIDGRPEWVNWAVSPYPNSGWNSGRSIGKSFTYNGSIHDSIAKEMFGKNMMKKKFYDAKSLFDPREFIEKLQQKNIRHIIVKMHDIVDVKYEIYHHRMVGYYDDAIWLMNSSYDELCRYTVYYEEMGIDTKWPVHYDINIKYN